MALLSRTTCETIAEQMGPIFSSIVEETETLDLEQMQKALREAFLKGVIKHQISSLATIRKINEAYCNQ